MNESWPWNSSPSHAEGLGRQAELGEAPTAEQALEGQVVDREHAGRARRRRRGARDAPGRPAPGRHASRGHAPLGPPVRIEPFGEPRRGPAEQREARWLSAYGMAAARRRRDCRAARRASARRAGRRGVPPRRQRRAGPAAAGAPLAPGRHAGRASGRASRDAGRMAGSAGSSTRTSAPAAASAGGSAPQTSARPPVLSSGKISAPTCSTRIGGRCRLAGRGPARPCRRHRAASISRVTSTTPPSVRSKRARVDLRVLADHHARRAARSRGRSPRLRQPAAARRSSTSGSSTAWSTLAERSARARWRTAPSRVTCRAATRCSRPRPWC